MVQNSRKKKQVAIIGSVGVPAKYGGFETLTEHLIENINEEYDFTVYCSGKAYPKSERKKTYKGAKLKYLPLQANGIQSILYDTLSIIHALLYADVLLILGVAGAWILPFVRLLTNKKIIISIDGIEWKRDKWNMLAKWYLFWAEGVAVKFSHIDISDNESIQDYTAARYGTLSRIIEYGANHTVKIPPTRADIRKYPFLNRPYAFKVCRIEPENNVNWILEAFTKINQMPLVMVGNWDKSEYGQNLKSTYAHHANIYIFDPIYDQQKLDVLRSNATLYIHGHSAGGTNPSLVEAMYLGLPIFAFDVSYNKVTTENKAKYFGSEAALISMLQEVDQGMLSKLGHDLQKVAKRRYTWSFIAHKYQLLIQESLGVRAKMDVAPRITHISYQQLLSMGHAHLKTIDKF